MSVYKDEKTGKWYALAWYHDWKGEGRQKCKRGFETKKEAQDWERSYVQQNAAGIDMTFEAFCGLYEKDRRPRLKESTWMTKENIIKNKLIPAFGKMMMSEIETKHIIAWQNELLAYRDEFKKPYSATYLKTVHNQLVAILNHAVRHYGLKSNPASKVGCIGSKEREEMNFWTKEEYMKFAEAIMDKPMSYYAFEMLYWCGIREGEMLALTPADFNFTKKTVRINKTYQRIHG
jgi:integrase